MSGNTATVWGRVIMKPRVALADGADETDLFVTVVAVPAHPDGIVMICVTYMDCDAPDIADTIPPGTPVCVEGELLLGRELLSGNRCERADPYLFLNNMSFTLRINADDVAPLDGVDVADDPLHAQYEALVAKFAEDSARAQKLLAEFEEERAESTVH